MATAKLKDSNSAHGGGLSDASSARDMAGPADGRSMRSHNEVLNTPSSMMGSQNNLNTSQYLLTSPAQQRKDTHQTNFSGGAPGQMHPNGAYQVPFRQPVHPDGAPHDPHGVGSSQPTAVAHFL